MADYMRARSKDQKRERLEEAMRVTDALFADVPYSDITLSSIASAMSISRSNLYKYITTKEEIFLELYLEKQNAFYLSLKEALCSQKKITPDMLTEILVTLLNRHTDYLRYQNILTSIIEVNVSVEALASFKKQCMPILNDTLALFQCCSFIPQNEISGFFWGMIHYACGMIGGCQSNSMISEALALAGLPEIKHDFCKELKHFIEIYLNGLQ